MICRPLIKEESSGVRKAPERRYRQMPSNSGAVEWSWNDTLGFVSSRAVKTLIANPDKEEIGDDI